jgi:hypothetical protein
LFGYDLYTGNDIPLIRGAALDWPDKIREPRAYGFHATLKPPFRLVEGPAASDLDAALDAFAKSQSRIDVGPVEVRSLGSFIAMVPAAPCSALVQLAGARPLPGADERTGTCPPPCGTFNQASDDQPRSLGLSQCIR